MGPIPNQEGEHDRPTQNEDNNIEDEEHPDIIVNAEITDSDSDVEDEFNNYMGYQALGQEVCYGPDTDSEEEEDDNEAQVGEQQQVDTESGVNTEGASTSHFPVSFPNFPHTENLPSYMQAPEVPRPEKKDLLWNQPRHSDTKLDTGQADKIKTVMSGFQLPSANIPDWAKTLSDDQWKKYVTNKLVNSETSQQEVNKQTGSGTGQEVNKSSSASCDKT